MNSSKNKLKNLTHPKCKLGTHLDTVIKANVCVLAFSFLFFFFFENVHYGSRVGRGAFFCFSSEFRALLTHKYFIQGGKKKKPLKLGPTVLFTHLKIILL